MDGKNTTSQETMRLNICVKTKQYLWSS